MGKIVRTLVLSAAMAGLVVAGGLVSPAQEKKTKDTKDTKAEKAGTIEIYEAKDGFRFRIKDADGRTVAQATKGYDKADDARKALESIKATVNAVKLDEVKTQKK